MKQKTLANTYYFEGKGLHTGCHTHMAVKPAEADSGIVFVRTDISSDARIPALAENVSDTSRSTTLSVGDACVHTVEHILSALTGLGIDNAIIEVDNAEIPILDGSAKPYIEAFGGDEPAVLEAERKYIDIKETIEIKDETSGAYVRITPAEAPSISIKVDFNSKVLGVQEAHWDESVNYAEEIGPCRTFVFFHEIEFLFSKGLVKGGDVDNAIIIAEYPVSDEQLSTICTLFNKEKLSITGNGYLNNLSLRFDDECGRHKLLDIIGDLRLIGGYPKAEIVAFKPGHSINTSAAKAVRAAIIDH